MPLETKSEIQPRRQSQRQSRRKPLYQADSSEDELGGEIQVSPSISKGTVPAKRNRSNSTTKPTSRPAAKRTKPAVDRKVKKWEPDFVTQNMKSPLVTNGVDLRSLLLQPAAWDVLSADDKREILSFFPADGHILDPNTPDARPNVTSLSSNDTFRHDAEEYVSNIGKGMHDLEWLRQAWVAHQRRAMGDFDEFYIRKVEVDWSTDIPDEHRPEHLRSVKGGTSSTSGGRNNVSVGVAPELASLSQSHEKDGASGNRTMKQDEFIEHASEKPTNGNDARTPDRGNPNGSTGVADSITVHSEEPPKSNGGPRFELIPSLTESEVDHASDHRGTANGAVTEVPQASKVEEVKMSSGSSTPDIKASSGEIAVATEAMGVEGSC
ncbi:hypothetical protein N0V93_006836 [Gnomoniopsis smithogilvyi]|uniref:ASX DEUBAD domain-containing protein n=1 Tax=Gnomoniopsis smithogilvyi TaxID=1191159 RepID=A0A9W8YQ51_9PEZI|nr:hypothetical protein N0V93_006836 [Gnomoniopsis smithogilvyi]